MFRFRRPSLIQVYYLDAANKNKLVRKSVTMIEETEKRNIIILVILMVIVTLLFFARTLTVFLVLLVSGLIIGIFAWIKLYKERREKR